MAAPIRPLDDAHEQAEELLPWYATGQLNDSDRALVERHLTACVECQKQLRFEQRMIEEFQGFAPEVDSGWARLRARIEPGQRWQPARPGVMRGAWDLLRRPAVATLAAAQLAFVVLAGGAFLSLSKPEYRALSSSTPSRRRKRDRDLPVGCDAGGRSRHLAGQRRIFGRRPDFGGCLFASRAGEPPGRRRGATSGR